MEKQDWNVIAPLHKERRLPSGKLVLKKALIFLGCLFLAFLFLESGARLFFRGTLLTGLALGALNYVPLANLAFTKVAFIDVGQGDAILLSSGTLYPDFLQDRDDLDTFPLFLVNFDDDPFNDPFVPALLAPEG